MKKEKKIFCSRNEEALKHESVLCVHNKNGELEKRPKDYDEIKLAKVRNIICSS